MTDFEIRFIPAQHTAALRLNAPMDEIGESMGQAFPRIYQAVTEAGVTPTGTPLARYFSFGGPIIDFECAIPVAEPFAGSDEVRAGTVGGGEAVVGTHVGPYDTIGQTWEALMAWLTEQGREPAGPGWESYLTDPSAEPDPAKWVTEVCLPVG
jgi:effector-binding domain-containing protein